VLSAAHDDDARLIASAPRVADYELRARLDEASHRVDGSGKLRFTNASRAAVSELYFHLYLNAFKNEKSLFLRSPFVSSRDEGTLRDWGYIDVTEMRVAEFGNADIWQRADRHSPGDPNDETDIRVPLPASVQPGESLNIEFKFRARLPPVLARTGHTDGFHMVAQWYPKLARLEPDGSFAHFAFHPHSEFYADFGRYDVQLDVADDLVVGATGKLTKSSTGNGRQRLHYRADDVHDFAWCAWEKFRTQTRQIGTTHVTLLYPPGHEENARVTLSTLAQALPQVSARFGRYPHETLTVVHPPDAAQAAGGMEYPTLITTGGPWWSAYTGLRLIESLTVHELGHQWFQGLVASDEHKYPFLDEGLTSYVEQSTLQDLYGSASFARILDWSLSGNALRRANAARTAHDEVIAQAAGSFSSFTSIGGLVYSRTATILETLARVYGRERLERALGRYARAHRFGHPTPSDLLDALESVLGENARQVAHAALFERGFVDFVAEPPESAPLRKPAGRFGSGTAAETIAPAADDGAQRASRVIVRRHGTLALPVEVELVFADGRRTRRTWDATAAWITIDVVDPEPVVSVIVDPDHRVLLDQNLFNNARSVTPRMPWRALTKLGYWSGLGLALVAP
jgi:hypothetical protein